MKLLMFCLKIQHLLIVLLQVLKIALFYCIPSHFKFSSKLKSHKEDIALYTSMCIVYGLKDDRYDSWIRSISEWIYSSISNSNFLRSLTSSQYYQKTLFASFGDELTDCEWNLYHLQDLVKFGEFSSNYEYFHLNDDLVRRLYCASNEMFHSIARYCLDVKTYKGICLDEISHRIHSVMDKHCVDGIATDYSDLES